MALSFCFAHGCTLVDRQVHLMVKAGIHRLPGVRSDAAGWPTPFSDSDISISFNAEVILPRPETNQRPERPLSLRISLTCCASRFFAAVTLHQQTPETRRSSPL